MTIAPWLIPPDFIGAASRGAALGLQRAQLESEAAQAADRLRLSYAQLSGENQARADATASRQQEAAAALALRGQLAAQSDADRDAALAEAKRQHDAQQAYQTGELGIRTAAEARQEKKATAADVLTKGINEATGKFLTRVSGGENPVKVLSDIPIAIHDPAVRSLLTQDAIAKRQQVVQDAITGRQAGKLDPAERIRYTDALSQRRAIQKQIDRANLLSNTNAAQVLKLQLVPYQAVIDQFENKRGPVINLPSTNAAPDKDPLGLFK